MRLSRTKLAAFVPTLAVLALVTVGATRPYPASRIETARLDASKWVEANKAHLPKHLDEIASYPLVMRKAIRNGLTLAQTEQLWREQLETFVRPRDQLSPTQLRMVGELGVTLTAAQVTYIRGVLDSLHVGLGEGTTKESREAFSKRTCAENAKLFPGDVRIKIFATLGPLDPTYLDLFRPSPSEAGFAGNLDAVLRHTAEKLGLRARHFDSCTCLTNSNCDCGWGHQCTMGSPACTPSGLIANCGCFFNSTCNGNQCVP